MARPREFDIEVAIADAMAVFWDHGYGEASLPQLLDGMGLTRGSLYKAFDGKKPLFLAALRAYNAEQMVPMISMLRDTTLPAHTRLDRVFRPIPTSVASGDTRGCLLCSAAASHAVDDPEIAVVVNEMLEEMRAGFAFAAQDFAQPDGIAQMLRAQYVGLQVLSRAGLPAADLTASVDAVLQSVAGSSQ